MEIKEGRECEKEVEGMAELDLFEHYESLYKERLIRFTTMYVTMTGGSVQDAEDVYAESRLRALKHFGSYDKERAYYTWRCQVIKNYWIDILRHKKDYQFFSLDTGLLDLSLIKGFNFNEEMDFPDLSVDIEQQAISREEKSRFWQHIRSVLGNRSKLLQIVKLRYVDDLRYNEIAKIVKCPEGTVKSRLSRARRLLKSRASVF